MLDLEGNKLEYLATEISEYNLIICVDVHSHPPPPPLSVYRLFERAD